MASAPNMRVAPSAAPTGTAAPAAADPLDFISRILAGQPEPWPVLVPITVDGEHPLPEGATIDVAPQNEVSAEGEAVAADPLALDGLIPLVQAQGEYAVAVTVKGNSAESPTRSETPEADSEGPAQVAPGPVATSAVPAGQPAAPQAVPAVQPDAVAKARPAEAIAAGKIVSAKKPIIAKAVENATGAEAPTIKPDADAEPIPSLGAAVSKTVPAEKMVAKHTPAAALRASATEISASMPTPPAAQVAQTPAPADATTPDEAGAQIAVALRGAVSIPESGTRPTPRQRIVPQAQARIAPSDSAPQAQAVRPSDATASDAQPPSSSQDNATPVQPGTPFSPAVAAAPSRPIDQAAGRIEPADPAIDRALDLARDGEWLDQLARDISSSGDRDGTLRFRLNPHSLGQLRVELSQGDHGTNVRLSVDTEAARTILADAQSRLVAEARAQGVRIAETQVDLSGSDQHMSGDPRRQDEARQGPMIRTAPSAGERDAPSQPTRSRSDRYA